MKTANSYASLLRGVSQQVAHERAEGQHTEQVNMLSDPVNGLVRRPGSIAYGEKVVPGVIPIDGPAYDEDDKSWLTLDFVHNAVPYSFMYRRRPRPVSGTYLPIGFVYNKVTKTFLDIQTDATDFLTASLAAGGISAITSVGKYLFMCGNLIATQGSTLNVWDEENNHEKAVIWVRGGTYSRTFSGKITKNSGATVTFSYTTPSSSYQGTLSTTDIPATATDYTKQVNDRVNAYNNEVTKWIGTAAAAIQPQAIATQISAQLTTAGLPHNIIGSTICFDATADVRSIRVEDGGDGSLIRAVSDEISLPSETSTIHAVGKVVKVRGKTSAEAYYLKAVPKESDVTTGYTEVTWVEGAGQKHTISGGLFMATIVGNTMYLASDATRLATLTPGPHPSFSVSAAGDSDTNPMPYFVNRNVTYLGTYKNRLLVGAGGVLACSKVDDYLNFFRTTVLTLPADDPFEMLAKGAEDDALYFSVQYDQDLVLFGIKRQYKVSGQVPLTPTSANMSVMSSYEAVADCPPVAAGGYIFYAKQGERSSNLYQIQPGLTDNSPEAFPASSQVDDYLPGAATEIVVATGSPSNLFMRMQGKRDAIFVFSYLDKQDGRKMDAWSRWDFNPALGKTIGMTIVPGGIIVFFLRAYLTPTATGWVAADFIPLNALTQSKPYLDSQRPWANVQGGLEFIKTTSGADYSIAFDATGTHFLVGDSLPNATALLAAYPTETGATVGANYDAYVTPTNPYMKDSKGKSILGGRLTITRMIVAFKDSVGFAWDLLHKGTTVSIDGENAGQISDEFNGRLVGVPVSAINSEPIGTGEYTIPIGKETRQYELTIKARKWFPLTVTGLAWIGQWFNRTQRY